MSKKSSSMMFIVESNLLTYQKKTVKNTERCESAKLTKQLPTRHKTNKSVTWSDIVRGKENRMSTNDNGLILLK